MQKETLVRSSNNALKWPRMSKNSIFQVPNPEEAYDSKLELVVSRLKKHFPHVVGGFMPGKYIDKAYVDFTPDRISQETWDSKAVSAFNRTGWVVERVHWGYEDELAVIGVSLVRNKRNV